MEKFNKVILKFNKYYYYLFKERFNKKINFNFPQDINRWDLITNIIRIKKFSSYLEIGCDDDSSFKKINLPRKVGVDPYSGGNFKGTSDNFFSINKEKFDCIFIDGLHEYNQVLRDIKNSLNFLNDNGIILVHDTLPPNIHQQAVPRYKKIWNGDVWKAIVKLRTKENYDIVTCKINQGLSNIRKIKNKKILNLKKKDYKKLKFKDFFYNHEEYMRIVKYDDIFEYLKR